MDRKHLTSLFILLITFFCTSCSYMCKSNCSNSMTDDEINESIQATYMADMGLADQSLRVFTYERVVTVKGNVQNETQRRIAIDYARNTCGVKYVISKIKIKSYDNT